MNRKIVVIGVVIVVVAVVSVALWIFLGGLGGVGPPVDVYARPIPSLTTDPASLLPLSVAGMTRTNVTTDEYAGTLEAGGIYEEDVLIGITRFKTAGDAITYVENGYESLSGDTTARVYSDYDLGEHWFTQTVSDESLFVWRRGLWVFEVYAPTEAIRNEVVQELDF